MEEDGRLEQLGVFKEEVVWLAEQGGGQGEKRGEADCKVNEEGLSGKYESGVEKEGGECFLKGGVKAEKMKQDEDPIGVAGWDRYREVQVQEVRGKVAKKKSKWILPKREVEVDLEWRARQDKRGERQGEEPFDPATVPEELKKFMCYICNIFPRVGSANRCGQGGGGSCC